MDRQCIRQVYQAVSDALAGKNMIPEVSVGKEKKPERTEVAKKAPEPFEQRRKFDEKTAVGKQIVEAAKVISQFEEIKKKQGMVREESSFHAEEKTGKNIPKIAAGNANTEQMATEKSKESVDKLPLEGDKDAAQVEKETVAAAKENASAALEQFLAAKEPNLAEVNKPSDNVAGKPAESGKENAFAQEVEKKTEPVWDKTNTRQQELFQTEEEQKFLSKEAKKHHKIIGQIFDTYWIVQYQDKMFLIDQHAAHEKVLFERTMKSLANKEITSQMLQPPIILSLSMREEQALRKHHEELRSLGFEIEAFGGREFSVRAVPAKFVWCGAG